MIRKPVQLAYGFKLVATWMLIPFIALFIPEFIRELRPEYTLQEVTLMEETYSFYPDKYLCFKAEVNGRERNVHAPITSKEGDTITVILRNGEYYKTPENEQDIKDTITFVGIFKKVCNNNFGYHAGAIAAVLFITFLLTFKKTKEIRKIYPKLSKITDIAGIVCSAMMSFLLVYAVIDGGLTGIGLAYLGLSAGIGYTAILLLAWLVEWCIISFAK